MFGFFTHVFTQALVLVFLGAASYSDLKTREVPDFLSYGMIASGLGLRVLYGIIFGVWQVPIEGIIGGAVFLLLGTLLFYTGQWGGGDSKLLCGTGVFIGFPLTLTSVPPLVLFIIFVFVFGALYGIIWSLLLAIRHWKRFIALYREELSKLLFLRLAALGATALLLALSFFWRGDFLSYLFLACGALVFFSFYLVVGLRAVENAAMIKPVPIEKLTEGDWIVEDVMIDGKRICGPSDLGIEEAQIKKLKELKKHKKIETVLVKEGIPFVPSFLFAFVGVVIFYSPLMNLLNPAGFLALLYR